jgi:drug/metabolite transporter (DMT)-like permease
LNRPATSRAAPLAALVFTSVVWGLSFLSIKVAVAQIPPTTLALARFVIASVVLMALLRIQEPKTHLKKRDVPRILLAGFVGVTLYFLFENNGIKLTSASAASIIVATIPILTLVAGALVHGERLTRWKIAAAVISFAGVYLVVGANFAALGNADDLWGSLLMLGAAASWVLYCFLSRPLSREYSNLALVTYQSVLATLTLVPLSLLELRQWRPVDLSATLNVVFLGLVCSAMGYVLYVYAQSKLGVAFASLFINFIPVVTVAAGFLVLGERISLYQITGGVLVVASVFLSEWSPSRRTASEPRAEAVSTASTHRSEESVPVKADATEGDRARPGTWSRSPDDGRA